MDSKLDYSGLACCVSDEPDATDSADTGIPVSEVLPVMMLRIL
jgi:hypothetical protein